MSAARRLGVFGGTFDPPHLGHTLAALWCLETGEVDRVLVVPVAEHAFGKRPAASFAQRLEMCRLAMERLGDGAEITDIEGRRPGVSYMVETLRSLQEEMPEAALRLIVGTDVVRDLPKWRAGEEVQRLAPPLVLPRPEDDARFADHPGALPPISSTAVRKALRTGRGIEHLISARVRAYIKEQGLYRP